MKTFTGKLANGYEYMGVESNDAWDLLSNNPEWLQIAKMRFDSPVLLGTYSTAGEIDFEVNTDWLTLDEKLLALGNGNSSVELHPEMYKRAVISLFDRDSRGAYPSETNPHKKPNPSDYFNTKIPINELTEADAKGVSEYGSVLNFYEESESQVRPKHWLIILKSKS